MGKIADVQEVTLTKLVPYVNNAKIHSEEQVTMIASSIREFGFLSPVLIDRDFNIIAGHGRVMAAKKLEMESVPCVFVEGLTEAQRKAYILADNRLSDLGTWDMEIAAGEFEELRELNFDLSLTGFSFPDLGDTGDWFSDRERNDTSRQEGNEEYNEFLDKFEQAKTTDDCYTPDGVYDAVAEWVAKEYKLDKSKFMRPFYPGGDYQNERYSKGCVVVDNPPFSILSEILRWYCERDIKFFLFAPTLTLFGSGRDCDVCYIPITAAVTYENGAVVNTSFITNLDDAKVRAVPELHETVEKAADEFRKELKRELPKYSYPNEVITASGVGQFSKYGVPFKVAPEECERISALDAQKEAGKAIYGCGFLISEKAAAEKAAAEKAAAEKAAAEKAAATVWQLSDREKQIVKSLGNP
jgi:hypothetical protein